MASSDTEIGAENHLPVLKSYKISVPNEAVKTDTKESDNDSDSDSNSSSSSSENSNSSNSSSSSSESEEGEISDDDDVEVNVLVGEEDKVKKAEEELLKGRANASVNDAASKFQSSFIDKRIHPEYPMPPLQRRGYADEPGLYPNPEIIEFDGNNPETNDIPEVINIPNNRIKRFGLMADSGSNDTISRQELIQLYKSLDLSEDDFRRGGWRPEAIFVKGIEGLQSKDIFEYFKAFYPQSVEWLNKSSCNVIWPSRVGSAKALLGLSRPIKPTSPASPNKMAQKENKNPRKEIEKKNKSKKDSKQKKKSKNSSDSSSNSDSSSDSDSDSSSSSSSSSSSDSSDSSSSSSSSDESGSDKKKKKKTQRVKSSPPAEDTVELPPAMRMQQKEKEVGSKELKEVDSREGNEPNDTNNNSTAADVTPALSSDEGHMEVDRVERRDPDVVTWADVGLPSQNGRWRLGVPCPRTNAIIMRFAHYKEKKSTGIENPIEMFHDYKRGGNPNYRSNPLSERIARQNQALQQLNSSPIKKEMPEYFAFPRMPHRRSNFDAIPRPPMPPTIRGPGYQDLDDPDPDGEDRVNPKNPWGEIAKNWSSKSTQDSLDYKTLLYSHMGLNKRKRPTSYSEPEDSDGEEFQQPKRKRSAMVSDREYRRPARRQSHRSNSHDDESNSSDGSGGTNWTKRIELPRMKMYADAEEKKVKKAKKSLKHRIHSDRYERMHSDDIGDERMRRSRINERSHRHFGESRERDRDGRRLSVRSRLKVLDKSGPNDLRSRIIGKPKYRNFRD